MTSTRTLRRYVAGRFFATILGAFAVCAVLIFMIDFVEMLRQAGKGVPVKASTLLWITILRLPAFTEILLAFAVLVGSIGALLMLSRRSELAVMRSAGMSVWQFIRPGITVAFALGVFAVAVYNPLAAAARAESERLFSEAFGKEANLLRAQSTGQWLRQDGPDGPSVLNAEAYANKGLSLTNLTILQFDASNRFAERIDARRAELRDGYWELRDAWVSRIGLEPEQHAVYHLGTYLVPERAQDALGSVNALSVWELPGLIEIAEKAGLSAARYRIHYELLLSRPVLLVAMVLLAATVSLRSFRSGNIQTMVVTGMIGGFGFLLMAEVSRQIGVAGLVSPKVAVWAPVVVVALVSTTVLLHQEDG